MFNVIVFSTSLVHPGFSENISLNSSIKPTDCLVSEEASSVVLSLRKNHQEFRQHNEYIGHL